MARRVGPGEGHERLRTLVGDWEGAERMNPGPGLPEGGGATGRYRMGPALDGFFVLADYEQEQAGERSFSGHAVFGWERATDRYTLHWFDCSGAAPYEPATGRWEEGGLVLTQQVPGPGWVRYRYTPAGDVLRVRLENSSDGVEWSPFLEGEYRRRG